MLVHPGHINEHTMIVSMPGLHSAGIGQRNRAHLERLHREESGPFDVGEASRVLGLEHETTARLLAYLSRRGWLSRIRQGLYVAVPLDARRSGEWIEDSWVVAEKAFPPCYVGGWSACEHWGLTEQVFRTVLVVTARTIHEREVVLQGITFNLTHRPEAKLFGTVPVWRGQSRTSVSDPSRTVVDILADPRLGGGIRHVASVLREYLASGHRDDDLLVEYGDRLGNRTVFKRLGYLMEQLDEDAADLVAACQRRRSAGLSALDPSVQVRGRILNRWGLRINVKVTAGGAEP